MVWEPSRCCCFSLRTGSLVLATVIIVCGVIHIVNMLGFLTITNIHDVIEEVCREDKDFESVKECVDLVTPVCLGIIISLLVTDAISVIISSLFVHGIRSNKTTYMIPFMIALGINIGLIILMALVIMGFFFYFGVVTAALIIGVIFGCITFLFTYFLLVVRALYREILASKGRIHVALTEQGYQKVNAK